MPVDVRRFADPEAVARAAAEEIAYVIQSGCDWEPGGTASIVLAGGTTPRRAYEILAQKHADLPWARVHVFWGDERCVPPDHPDSNYAMAKRALLDHVGVDPAHVHRIPGELGAEAAAEAYQRELDAFHAEHQAFDVVLLGMGDDGHTASLFPGHPAVQETVRRAVPVETQAKAPRWRVSLTLPELAASSEVLFLVTGTAKHTVLRSIVANPDAAASRYPAAAVRPAEPAIWLVDEAAYGGGGA